MGIAIPKEVLYLKSSNDIGRVRCTLNIEFYSQGQC